MSFEGLSWGVKWQFYIYSLFLCPFYIHSLKYANSHIIKTSDIHHIIYMYLVTEKQFKICTRIHRYRNTIHGHGSQPPAHFLNSLYLTFNTYHLCAPHHGPDPLLSLHNWIPYCLLFCSSIYIPHSALPCPFPNTLFASYIPNLPFTWSKNSTLHCCCLLSPSGHVWLSFSHQRLLLPYPLPLPGELSFFTSFSCLCMYIHNSTKNRALVDMKP